MLRSDGKEKFFYKKTLLKVLFPVSFKLKKEINYFLFHNTRLMMSFQKS